MFKKHEWLVLATYALMLGITLLITMILVKMYNFDPFHTTIYTNMVVFLIGAAIIYMLLNRDLKDERKAHPLRTYDLTIWVISGVFLTFGGQMVANVIEIELLGIKPGSENTHLIVELTKMNPIFLLLPAIIGPIVEELVFRKVLFGGLRRKMNIHVAAVISSLIFAVFHAELEHLLVYFVIGLIFVFLYVKTNRIIVPMLVHMSMNTITVLVQRSIDPEELERMLDELSFIFLGGWF